MKSYISKPQYVKKIDIENKFYSLLAAEYRRVEVLNNNQKPIGDLVDFESVGEQIEVQEYLTFKSEYYLGTISCMGGLIYDKTKGECISPNIYKQSKKKLKKGDVVISRNASLGKISYVNDDANVILNGGLSYLRFKNEFKYYSIAFFLVNYGAEYLTCLTSGGGTQQNAKRQNLLELRIPFPTKNSHPEPKKIEQLVSLITQNIISKEAQIKAKNQKIDEAIEKELKENQNSKNSFKYSYPKISEIKQESRLDTGIYEREVKEIDFLIKNYKSGSFSISDDFNSCRGQNLQVSQIGESYYSDYDKKGFYRMFTNVEMQDDRTISGYRWLGNKNKLTTLPDNAIMLAADGMIVGRAFFYDIMENTITNIHPWIITPKLRDYPIFNRVFLCLFLSYLKNIAYLEKIKDKSNGGGLKKEHLDRWIKIPNFTDSKQQEIAKEYYNKIDKNQNLTLENFLQKETARNQQIGIFQLNMEIFTLREKLEDVIDKIINDLPIEINLNY